MDLCVPGGLFKSKEQLKKCLQEQDAYSSGWTEEEYYKQNAHVDLDEYCEIYHMDILSLLKNKLKKHLEIMQKNINLKIIGG